MIAVASAAVVASGLLVGTHDWREDSETPAALLPGSNVAAQGRVKADRTEEDVRGSCFAPADGHSVNISLAGTTTKINVVLDDAQPPNVSSVVLSTSSTAFVYEAGKDGDARVTRDGTSFHITGTFLYRGFAGKPFDIAVTCA